MRITTVLISTGFHIGARILQHACHSTHTRVRMPRHAYRSTHAGARISKYAYRSTRTGAPNGNGSAGQARPLPLDCFLQVRAQRPGASALCAVWAKPLSSLWASLLGARDGAGRQPGRRAQKCAAATCSEQAATPSATSFPARRHCRMLQATPGSHRGRGILHRPPNENGSAGQALRVNGEERGPVPCSLSRGILFRFAFGRSRGRCDSMRSS